MKAIAKIKLKEKLEIYPLRFKPFDILQYLDTSLLKKKKSAWIEFGSYTVGTKEIIGIAHVKRGKVVHVTMRPTPDMIPLKAIENDEVKHLVKRARAQIAKTVKRRPMAPIPLSEFIRSLHGKGNRKRREASDRCFSMFVPIIDCYALCCDFEVGFPCWWVCSGRMTPFPH